MMFTRKEKMLIVAPGSITTSSYSDFFKFVRESEESDNGIYYTMKIHGNDFGRVLIPFKRTDPIIVERLQLGSAHLLGAKITGEAIDHFVKSMKDIIDHLADDTEVNP